MKNVVINFSGNVGKSTVAAHLLKPRMNNATLFSIETLNDSAETDGVDVETYKGKKFKELQEEIFLLEDAIVDVGASNVEDFINLMTQYHDSHKQFDYFILPTVKEKKQTIDTINTIEALFALGIPKNKIRVIMNKVEMDDEVTEEFKVLFGLEATEKTFVINEKSVIYNNEAFDQCKDLGVPLADIVADQTDYRAKAKVAKDAGNQVEASRCINLCLLKMVATTADNNLDQVFKTLFK
ncbi:MAG: plasmid stabilization protein [Methyloglobulus sp.]|nr:plasmid stabilization protein [Methyloglobulus sp.]NOU21187.1 plasmid stabilization protein [Methyloglobulus sp.]